MRLEVPLDGEDADPEAPAARTGRGSSPAALSRPPSAASASISRPGIASPSSIEALATRSGSAKWVASTMARAPLRVRLLKMPDPTKLPSAPSCIISAASARVAMPPAQKSRTEQAAEAGDLLDDVLGARVTPWPRSRAARGAAGEPLESVLDLAHVANGLDDVAGPGLALGADHRGALADAAQRLAEVGGAADEGHVEGELVYVVGLVGRREHLGLVYVVHLGGDWRICASAKWPMRALAITGMVTASWISLMIAGFDIRATPPCARISAGTRSRKAPSPRRPPSPQRSAHARRP